MVPPVSRTTGDESVSKSEREKKKLKEACREFESVMSGYMLKSMRESVMRAEEPDHARQVYEGMLDDSIAREMSRNQSNGLAELLYRQLAPLLKKDSLKTG